MSWDRDAISGAYVDHVYESREGSRGATGAAGGGCGCILASATESAGPSIDALFRAA